MHDSSPIVGFILLIVLAVFYFLPALVAQHRGRDGILVLTFLNLILAWTVIGWIVLLVVAFTGENAAARSNREEHVELLRKIAERDQEQRPRRNESSG